MIMEDSGVYTLNWAEEVEDLKIDGEFDKAISILESVVSNLEKQVEKVDSQNDMEISSFTADQLATALHDLYELYSGKGFSLRADQTLSRALQIKQRQGVKEAPANKILETHPSHKQTNNSDGIAEDDWEAIADRVPEEFCSPQYLPEVSKLSLEDSIVQGTKRRGRGTFSYNNEGMYSDNPCVEEVAESNSSLQADDSEKRYLIYGTHHVLVLADFPPSTRTTDLEKVLEKFKDLFVIRWVNDTTALAVFRTVSVALEANKSVKCPYTVRILDENDELVAAIIPRDLEPPRQRPPTSARTAQRMIAQGMGIKLPSKFGSTELRKQEEVRKNRILSRQNMRDDAWGTDEN